MREVNQKEKELFIRYGTAASEAMFDFPCHFFQIPNFIGFVPYRIEAECAVVFGEPVCPCEEIQQLTQAFHSYCSGINLHVLYIIASEEFNKWMMSLYGKISLQVCEELIFDPSYDPCLDSSRLRHRVEKAEKHGLTIHEYIPFDSQIEDALKDIGLQWKKRIKGPNIYLGHLNFFQSYLGKRWFYVKDKEEITGMVMLSRIESANGWLLKFLMVRPTAFPDTSEFLMNGVLNILRNENSCFLSKGMTPANSLGEVVGLSSLSSHLAKAIYKVISNFFKFKKRKEYWLRYNPHLKPTYLIICRPFFGLKEMKALTKVFKTNYLMN